MTILSLHLQIVGGLLIVLSFSHLYFGRYLNWKSDAVKLSPINRQIFHVHTFFICFVLVMMGILCLFFPHALLPPAVPTLLSKLFLIGMTVFWVTRLVFQWCVYDSSLWRGHRLNTVAHLAFSLLWIYFTLIFALALRAQFA